MPIFTIRKYARFAIRCPAYYMGPTFLGKGCIQNLSLGGWRVEGGQSVRPGLILTLAVFIPDEPKAIRIERAAVRWTSEGTFGLTVVIIKPAEVERLSHLLKRFLNGQDSHKRMVDSFKHGEVSP